MKTQILLIGFCIATLHAAHAEIWTSKSHDCSLAFSDGMWTLHDGVRVLGGQVLLQALNQRQNKEVTVFRQEAATTGSVRSPRFAAGVRSAYENTGATFLSEGYTNVNGRDAYWFTGQGLRDGQKVSQLAYTIYGNGEVYVLMARFFDNDASPNNDNETLSILKSFRILATAPLPAKPIATGNDLAFRIGCITGFLLVLIAGAVVLSKRQQKHSDTNKLPSL